METGMETLEGNKLIAEFDGKINEGLFWYTPTENWGRDGLQFTRKDKRLKYHLSWDWLMPVVQKIESLGYCVSIFRGCCDIEPREINQPDFEGIETGGGKPKIDSTWQSVVKFIQWYNTQSK